MVLKNFKLFFILFFLSSSCYREETIVPPVNKEGIQPVVLCFIGPGDSIYAYVTMSQTFSTNPTQNNVFFEGSIQIFDSLNNSIMFKKSPYHNNKYSASQKDMPIIPGKTYKMVVTYFDTITSHAITKVPNVADKLESIKIIGNRHEDDYVITYLQCYWKKNSTQNNLIGIKTSNTSNFDSSYIDPEIFITDIDSVRKTAILNLTQSKQYTIILYTINEPFGSFIKTYNLFFDTGINLETNDITMLFNGIFPRYTNFNKCLGVFGAFVTDSLCITENE